ncbi:caspase recruitment domain-containing protein 19 isoform X3 [Eptesicus fuscus]|uniref:caspase recruitment domain-containing protein 19 isoform X3 n=1 Tax=Eptesicus fuscus TaxID=29078 RepID=UPI0024043CEC|nr:caspase recruitment domain-containing protein 19 isoform X3 [Eptesicus fuscus]
MTAEFDRQRSRCHWQPRTGQRADLLRPAGAGHAFPAGPWAPERAAGGQDHPAAEPLLPPDPQQQGCGKENSECADLDSGTTSHALSDRGPMAFLACLGLAAGLALLVYCCPPDPKVPPGARRVLGFSPLIMDRHVSRFLLAFLAAEPGGL